MSVRATIVFVLTLISGALFIQNCETTGTGSGPLNEIEVPDTYSFESRFTDSTSSVEYAEPIVCNLLVQDLKSFIDYLGSDAYNGMGISEQDLLNYYEHRDSYDMATLTSGTGFNPKKEHYSDIASNVDLASRISDDPIYGASDFDDQTANELIRTWFTTIAQNSQDPDKRGTPEIYTTANNLDLSQLIHSLLVGSVIYHQATGKYLSVVHTMENREASNNGTASYTEMEHYWDKAFGYFGSARNLNAYSDSALAGIDGQPYFDSNNDNLIDFESEYNFVFPREAGKRDSEGESVDFTGKIFQSFLEGRTNITNQRISSQIKGSTNEVALAWDKLIAATVIHYINLFQREMLTHPINQPTFNRYWAGVRGYVFALQYNPYKQISNIELRELVNLLGDKPPVSSDFLHYSDNLNAAKVKLKNIYDFSTDNMERW